MATTQEKWQEIANRGLQDRFDPATRAKFDEAVRRGLITIQQQDPVLSVSALNPDVPGIEGDPITEKAPQPERSLLDEAIGLGEAALTLGTGATGGAIGFGLGATQGILDELTGRIPQGEGINEATRLASELTFQPRTEAGQENVKALGDVLGVLPPVLGTTPLNTLRPLVSGKFITDRLLRNPRAKRALLADEIRRGNPNIENVTKALDASGEIITRPASKRAVKILGGDHVAKGTVSVLENMNSASKSQVNKMLNNIERGRKEPLFGDANRPSDILGESVLNRAKQVSLINKKAGETIGNTAKSLKDVNVDIGPVNNQFFNKLNELGVTFKRGDDGWVTPDFSRSKFIGGSQKEMTVLINDLLDGTPSFETAHKLKRTIRDNIDFDTGGTGQIKGASQQLLKDLSSGIDDVLDTTSPKYKKANESFAKTIKLKNDFDKLVGKDIDVGENLSAEILGGKVMRLDSNAVSRTAIKKLLLNTDDVLGEFGVRFKDDIPSLVHITSKLNDSFKLSPGGSLKGNIVSGGLDVAEAASGPIGAARVAAKKLSQIKDPDFNKKLRAFRSLTTNQDK